MRTAEQEPRPTPAPDPARRRTAGITILAVLAGVVALRDLWTTLQYLGILPAALGTLAFYDRDLMAAILWGFTAATWVWAAASLWRVRAGTTNFFPVLHWLAGRLQRPQVLVFLTALAGWNLTLTVLSLVGGSAFWAMFPDLLLHGGALLYLLSPGVRRSFGAA